MKINEGTLRKIVKESLKKALKEQEPNPCVAAPNEVQNAQPKEDEADRYVDYPPYDEEMGYGAMLESIVRKNIRKAIKESKRNTAKGTLTVNGHDFLERALDSLDVDVESLVNTDECLSEIANTEFKVTAEEYSAPATYWQPAEGDFEILDDEGLYDLIESVSDEQVKSALLNAYESEVEGGEYDWYGPEDFQEDPYDAWRDRHLDECIKKALKKALKENKKK